MEAVRQHDQRMTKGMNESERAELIAALCQIETAPAREENNG